MPQVIHAAGVYQVPITGLPILGYVVKRGTARRLAAAHLQRLLLSG